MPRSDSPDAVPMGFLLAKALQRWNERFSDGMARRGLVELRPAYCAILLPLFAEDGLVMGELAQRARLSKQTVTTLVRDMRERGLVRRIRDVGDARAFRIYLSARARKLQVAVEAALGELHAEIDASLSPGDARRLRAALVILMNLGAAAIDGTPAPDS